MDRFIYDLKETNTAAKIQRIWLPDGLRPSEHSVLTFGDLNNDGYEDFIVDTISNT